MAGLQYATAVANRMHHHDNRLASCPPSKNQICLGSCCVSVAAETESNGSKPWDCDCCSASDEDARRPGSLAEHYYIHRDLRAEIPAGHGIQDYLLYRWNGRRFSSLLTVALFSKLRREVGGLPAVLFEHFLVVLRLPEGTALAAAIKSQSL